MKPPEGKAAMKAPGRGWSGGAPTMEQELQELLAQAERLETGLRSSLGRLSQPFNSSLSLDARGHDEIPENAGEIQKRTFHTRFWRLNSFIVTIEFNFKP